MRTRPATIALLTLALVLPGTAAGQFADTEVSGPGAPPFLLSDAVWTYEAIADVEYAFYRQRPGEDGFSCIHSGETASSWVGDPDQPGPGEVFFYLVTAHDGFDENQPGTGTFDTPRTIAAACPAPMGACCESTGGCLGLPAGFCATAGGDWQGLGTSCFDVPDPCPPLGACCDGLGGCELLSEEDCAASGGTWTDALTRCTDDPDPCPAIGACCDGLGGCSEESEDACLGGGGTWSGPGTTCADDPDPCPAIGACCGGIAGCADLSEDQCLAGSGTWSGPGTTCADDPDPCAPVGACCGGIAGCADLTEDQCLAGSGTWSGPGTTCADDPDPCAPVGACCGGIAGCADLTEDQCLAGTGTWSGPDTTCADDPDPCAPVGACCDGVGGCFEADRAGCEAAGGIYAGDGETCGGVPDPCPCGGFPAAGPVRWVRFATVGQSPVDLRGDPTDANRLFVVDQPGRILILEGGVELPAPFLDIRAAVRDNGNEQGLLGLAFHPDHAANGLFYIYYTSEPAGATTISELRVSVDPNVADPASERILFTTPQPATNHNGGALQFSPRDGYLYAGLGDGGQACDTAGGGNHAQNPNDPLGTILRLDVDDPQAPLEYGIPADNPYVGGGGLPEVWAHGLRNPWRMSFDRLTHDLWIGDVGQDTLEEVDRQPASSAGGENYGWVCMEGTAFDTCGRGPGTCGAAPDPSWVPPVVEYPHEGAFCSGSITGGYVYRGAAIPSLRGHYFYSDYCRNRTWSVRHECGAVTESIEWSALAGWPGITEVTTYGEDADGELYIVSRSGGIWRLEP